MSTGSLTWRAVLDDVRARLAAAGVENAGQEARWLAEAAAGCAPGGLASGLGGPVEDAVAGRLAGLVERRVAGEPLQYVVRRWGFRRLELAVDPRVLIPRPETEVLAGLALEACDRLGARVVADLGTGSGALALTLATERADLQVWATDVSGEALEVAEANRAALGAGVNLVEGSWYEALPSDVRGWVDVIVSNPPYVSEAEMRELGPEVRDWEPAGALCAGPDGLEDVAAVIRGAPEWLARPGELLVEMAPHQTQRAAQLARDAGFGDVEIRKDLAGRERVLVARW
jgi:release factor glutamine methyltransferase